MLPDKVRPGTLVVTVYRVKALWRFWGSGEQDFIDAHTVSHRQCGEVLVGVLTGRTCMSKLSGTMFECIFLSDPEQVRVAVMPTTVKIFEEE